MRRSDSPVQQVFEAAQPGNSEWLRGWCRGEDVFVVAGGASLCGFDFSRLEGRRVVAVNRSLYYCRADVVVFLDAVMGTEFRKELPGFPDSIDARVVAGHCAGMRPSKNVTVVRSCGKMAKPIEPSKGLLGRATSAQLGISVALAGEARAVYLLGVDANGRGHFYPHPAYDRTNPRAALQYQRMASAFDGFEPWRDRIINLNPDSSVRTFDFMDPSEVL